MKHIIIILFITLSFQAFSQVVVPEALSVNTGFEVISDTSQQKISLAALMNNTTTLNYNDSLLLKVRVKLGTIQDIDKIHVKVGSTLNGNDVAQYIFQFDNSTGLPTDYSYNRDEGNLKLIMGKFVNPPIIHFTEVMIEDINGNFSAPKTYQSN